MKYDIIIIGGGIVGLATALKLKESNQELKIALLEKETELAKHQTGNNSGVIHAGVYYKPGSLKAINCRKGYQMLIDFCDKEDIKYELCGKLIVATKEEEIPGLEDLGVRSLETALYFELEPGSPDRNKATPRRRTPELFALPGFNFF